MLRVARAHRASAARRLAARLRRSGFARRQHPDARAICRRCSLVLVACALSLVTSRHQARRLFVELERAQARARAATRPSTASCSSSSRRGACRRASRRSRASSCACSCRRRGASRSSTPTGDGADEGRQRCARAPARRARRCRGLRAPIVFGALALLFAGLARPLAVPAVDRQRVPAGRRAARATRASSRCPRIAAASSTASASALALSTPVKSLWAFPDKFEATPDAARGSSRASSRRRRSGCSAQLDAHEDFAFVAQADRAGDVASARWRCASRGCTTRTSIAATTPAAK